MSKDACGHPCTVTGALWRPNGRYFDGSDDEIGHPTFLDTMPSALTIITWVNLTGKAGEDNYICGKSNVSGDDRLVLGRGGNTHSGEVWFRTEGQAQGFREVLTTGVVTFNTWHFIAAVYNPGVEIRAILNEEDVAYTAVPPEVIQDGTHADFVISSFVPGAAANQHIEGYMGEFIAFSRAFSPVQLQNIRLATKWRYR